MQGFWGEFQFNLSKPYNAELLKHSGQENIESRH